MYIIYILLFTLSVCISAQGNRDNLFLKDKLQPISEENIFKSEKWFNWGSSIIKGDDGLYHLFYSRWGKKYTFLGWLTFSEIAHAVSNTPSGPWKYKETALRRRGEGFWDAITAHNPKIKYFEGKYYLYYISTNLNGQKISTDNLTEVCRIGYNHYKWKILRSNQRTGVDFSNSLNGPWNILLDIQDLEEKHGYS